MNGVIVIDKPKGVTSHDVVASVKRRLRANKVGHLGTLDPNATGVLPLVVNRATKLASFLGGMSKAYTATMRLGIETDTYDVEGKVIETRPVEGVKREDIERVLKGFVGEIEQVPPMFSAVKRKGTPLYKLARKGVTVEREPKVIHIRSIEVVDIELPDVVFNVECSRGTYIRTLCHDVGLALKVGGHLADLRRTLSGCFTIEEACPLDVDLETMRGALIPVEDALGRIYKEIKLSGDAAARVLGGASMIGVEGAGGIKEEEIVRLTFDKSLIALARYGRDGIFKVNKHFNRGPGSVSEKLQANSRQR
ncbi:MAG: tRNA pseudouridine(55) synthase TruB [Thermodesulfobacteriota bacterium]